ncbi:MAG: NAD-dependent deacylase [Candidatus Aminicenantes bacterium RBG_16_63_16]|nr:MAG: NAD-dependent deacylase [Candidatus Aminicenantes bacterium RBG_16_63_16]
MTVTKDKLDEVAEILRSGPRVAALTGSGISAESGVPTFRGKEGLWKQFRAEELATPEAFARDPRLVWEWYDWRRAIIGACRPNPGHQVLVRWEKRFPGFVMITQNVDGLHRQAGSERVLELHGNIWEMRCTVEGTVTENRDSPLGELPPHCPACGAPLRPNVVWFGEMLSAETLQEAYAASANCDLMFVVGTSAFVQPAGSLPLIAAERGATIVEINPDITPLTESANFSFREKSGEILPMIDGLLAGAPAGVPQ